MLNPTTFPLPADWRIVATGFGAFGPHTWNPSRVLAAMLAELAPDRIRFEELPVTWEAARSWERSGDPRVLLLHFGLAGQAKEVRVETLAVNASSDTPDNDGQIAECPCAATDAPPSIGVQLDAPMLVKRLQATGAGLVMASEDCGRYVCNATLYHSLLAAPARAVFIHIPPMDEAACGRWARAFHEALLGLDPSSSVA